MRAVSSKGDYDQGAITALGITCEGGATVPLFDSAQQPEEVASSTLEACESGVKNWYVVISASLQQARTQPPAYLQISNVFEFTTKSYEIFQRAICCNIDV